MKPISITEADHARDLEDLRETDPIYGREKIVHPGTVSVVLQSGAGR